MSGAILVTQPDFERLEQLLDGWWATDPRTQALLARLQDELDKARVVDTGEIAPECVTIGSSVSLLDLDTGRVTSHRLVLPKDADGVEGALSILSPLGVAVLGYRVGDAFECDTPGGRRRLRVESVGK